MSSISHAPSSPWACPSRSSFAVTQWISIVYWWRSSSGSTKAKGRSSCGHELRDGPVVGVDADMACCDIGSGIGVARVAVGRRWPPIRRVPSGSPMAA